MINIAIVGYMNLVNPSSHQDLVWWMPQRLEGLMDLHFCHQDIIENRDGKEISEIVKEALETNPDVIHYANYRDPYNQGNIDEEYIRGVLKVSDVPILLTSGNIYVAEEFTDKLGIDYLSVPFGFKEYADRVKSLALRQAE